MPEAGHRRGAGSGDRRRAGPRARRRLSRRGAGGTFRGQLRQARHSSRIWYHRNATAGRGSAKSRVDALPGRRVKAEEALGWGLADLLVPQDQLRAAAVALASEIAEAAPLAVQATRATMRAGLAELVQTQTAHELSEQAKPFTTADFREGVRAVAERRA